LERAGVGIFGKKVGAYRHTHRRTQGRRAGIGATVGVAYDTTAENTLYGCFQNKAPAGNITLPTLAFIAKVWATPKKPKK